MAFDEMTQILMTEGERKFDRVRLTRLPGPDEFARIRRTLTDAFRIPGRDERVRVEQDETGKDGGNAIQRQAHGIAGAID